MSSWTVENRLINASNQTTQISYSYDYMGRRFRKVVDDGSSVTTNHFVYDGWNLIAETDGSSTNHYVWGLDLSGSMQGAGGIGGLLATVQDGDVYFSCFDANGNLTDYVDEDGSNVAHYVYGPFGGTIDSTGDKKDDFRFRFSTKYLDDETALYYYGYRHYNPEMGRWVSRDPAEDTVADGVYMFAGNQPISSYDLLGLLTQHDCMTMAYRSARSKPTPAGYENWDCHPHLRYRQLIPRKSGGRRYSVCSCSRQFWRTIQDEPWCVYRVSVQEGVSGVVLQSTCKWQVFHICEKCGEKREIDSPPEERTGPLVIVAPRRPITSRQETWLLRCSTECNTVMKWLGCSIAGLPKLPGTQ